MQPSDTIEQVDEDIDSQVSRYISKIVDPTHHPSTGKPMDASKQHACHGKQTVVETPTST